MLSAERKCEIGFDRKLPVLPEDETADHRLRSERLDQQKNIVGTGEEIPGKRQIFTIETKTLAVMAAIETYRLELLLAVAGPPAFQLLCQKPLVLLGKMPERPGLAWHGHKPFNQDYFLATNTLRSPK